MGAGERSYDLPENTHFLLCLVVGGALAEAQVNVVTWHNDNARTGQNLEERILDARKRELVYFWKAVHDSGRRQGGRATALCRGD